MIRVSDINDFGLPTTHAGSKVYLQDCLEGMRGYPDNYFDLAVVDPPYGINADRPHTEGNGWIYRETSGWDKTPPSPEYFDELKRVTKNQIIFGANHFLDNMPFNLDSACWLVWDKGQRNFSLADGELAWTSFKTALRIFEMSRVLAISEDKKYTGRFHPTQKPVKLYDWIFKNYAKEGDKILDTHLGSGSSRIAAYKAGLDFTAYELDEEYFDKSEDRFKKYVSQIRLEL